MTQSKRLDCSRNGAVESFKVATAKFVETAKREVGNVII